MPFAPPAPDEIESAGFTPPARLGGFTPPSPEDTEELGQETSLSPSEVETGPDEKPAGFLRSLARGFVAPIKATAKGVGIATLSDDTLQTALNSEWQKNQNAVEPTTAGKVGEMVGGLGGTLAQMLVTGQAGPAGIAAQFGSQGAYDSFMAAGQRALSEGHSLAEATQIGKYAALTGVGTGILLGLVPGGHDTWKQVVSTALKMGAAGGGQKLLENVAQQNQGLQTPTWEGVPEAAATMALIPPGMKVLGSGLAALARRMPGRGRGRISTTDNTDDTDGDGGGGTPAVAPVTAPQADAAAPAAPLGDAGTAADVQAGLNLLGRGIRAGAQEKAEEYARRILGGQPIEEVTQGLGPVMRQAIGEAITRLKESELQNAIQESKAASVHVQPAPADRAALAEGGGTAEGVAGAQPEPKRVALEPDTDQEAVKQAPVEVLPSVPDFIHVQTPQGLRRVTVSARLDENGKAVLTFIKIHNDETGSYEQFPVPQTRKFATLDDAGQAGFDLVRAKFPEVKSLSKPEIQPLGEKPNPPELAQKPDFVRGQTVLHTDPATGVPREVKFDFEYGDGTARVRSGLNQWRVPVAELTNKPRAPRVNRGLNFKAQFDRETQEMGEPDLLGWLRDHGGMMSRSAALKLWGKKKFAENASLWEDAQPFATHHHQAIFGGSNTPDQVVQALNMKSNLDVHGNFGVTDVNSLWHEINQASKARANRGNVESAANQRLAEDLAQHQAWFKATQKKPGLHEVTTESIGVGDVLEVGGERVKVTARSPDTGDLRLEDGKTFGEQKLEEGQVLYVEKVEQRPEVSVEEAAGELTTDNTDGTDKGKEDTLPAALEKYEGTGNIETVRDLADEVERLIRGGKAPESLQAAVDTYREALREDFQELAGRGDTDAAEESFLNEIRKAAKPESAAAAGEPTRLEPTKPFDVSAIRNAQTEQEALTETGRLMREAKTTEELAQVQKAIKERVTELKKPTLELAKPESVDEQNARLAREAQAKAEREAGASEAARQAEALRQGQARLGGDLGTAGQGELLAKPGQQEIFQATPAAQAARDARKEQLRQRIKDKLNDTRKMGIKPGKGLDPTIFSDAVQLGAIYIQEGLHRFAEWSGKMLEDFGEAIQNHLKSIYETAKVTIESPRGASAQGRGPGLQPGLKPPAERIILARPEFTHAADESILPANLVPHLDAHQRQGAAAALHALNERGGFLNADGTGAGKTRQAITVAHHYAEAGKKVLIVTKAETIKQDWARNTFGGSYGYDSGQMGVKIKLARDGQVAPGEIGITTYENLASVAQRADKDTVLIFDEAHALKNDSQRAKAGMQAIARSDRVMFMSATPADKAEHIYYLAPMGIMEGKTVQQQLLALGMKLQTVTKKVKTPTGWRNQEVTFWIEDPLVTDRDRRERFSALFDRMTDQGAMIKREISMDGVHVQVLKVALPPEGHEIQQNILNFFDAKTIDDLQGLRKALVLGHQRRQQEPFKVAPTVMLAQRELEQGRQVVIFVSRVNESEVGKWVQVAGPGGQRERMRQVLMSSPGTAKLMAEALRDAGIHDIAEIHGNADQGSLEAMADFQGGRKRVVIATIDSGGTGINLDDTLGNRPRSMIMVTAPFDAVGNVQAAGRIWRLKTLSGSSLYYLFGDTKVDDWNADIIGSKMSMLGAVVEGQVRKLDVSNPDLVGTDDFHQAVKVPLDAQIEAAKQAVKDAWDDTKKLGISPDGDLQRQLALYKSLYDLAVLYARKGVKTAGEFADAVGMKAGAILNRAWADASSGKPAETNPAKLPRLTADEAKEISAPRQTTQVLGAEMGIGSRPGASPQADAAAVAKQHELIVQAGGQLAHLVEPGARGLVKFVPDGFTHEAEGHNLVKLINDELPANWEANGAEPYSLTALFNSIRTAWWDGSLKDVFGEPVARKLFTTVQAPISHWGLLLQSVQRFGNSIAAIAKDPLVHLRYEWGKAFGGETYDRLFDRVMATLLPDLDRHAKEALREHPQVEDLFKTLMEQNARAAGSRVFRKADFLLGPKAAKRIEAMKRDAEVNEAVQEILNQARRLHGLEPPKRPGRTKLTPVEELLHLVNRDNAAKIDDSIKTAVRQAERNAARNIVQAEGSYSEEEMALYDQRTLDPKVEAIDPTDEQAERGLDSKRWRPWQKVRETLADYSPVTLDLAQRVIKGDFKGTQFKPTPEKAADLRIDLKKLAVGPEAEVKRVLDAWQEAVSRSVDLAGAAPETRLRIRAMMEKELATQLELKRQQARDPLFVEKFKKGAALSPEEKMLQLLNAKLFADPRLDLPGMVERVAGQSAVQRLLPTMGELTGKILETPFFKQAELKSRFVEELTQRLGVDPAQAEKAWVTFESAFASRFAAAKAKAAERALKDLTPAERKVTRGRGLIEKIQRNLNAGNFDSGDVIEQIARAKGERVPDPADVAKLKSMGERLARLQQLDDKEMAELTATKATPEQIEKARAEKEAKTRSLQATLSRDMSTLWASMWRPLNLRSFTSGRGWRNVRDASRDYVVLNLLTKVGHLVRFPIHLATQVATHFGSRPLAQAFELAGQRGNVMASWEDIGRAYQQEWEGMKAGLKPALVGGRAEALGRGEGRNVDALMETMHTFGRLEQQAEKYKAQGNWPMYVLTRILGIPNYAGRYISVVDQWQGAPAVYADILHQADLEMARAGHSGAERVAMQGDLVKAMKYEIAQAMHETGLVLQSSGQPFTAKQVEENAWGLVKFRLEELIRNAGLPADAMRETTEALRRQLSWQDEVRRGVGGPVAKSLQWLGKAVPTLGAFSNAIGHGLNWTLAKLPPGLHYLADVNLIGKAGEEPSNYFRTSLDKKQRLLESIGVTMGGAMLAGLLMNRMARFNPFITSANERAEMEREGRKPGTIDFLLPDGKVSTWSLIVGPMSLFAPWISAFGSASNLQQRREGAQKRLDEEATRKGLAPGKIRELGLLDYAGVAAQAAMTSILGSKTASGWTTQFVDPNQGFAAKRAIASQIQPFITGLPGWGEISRMMGVSMSQNRATVFDYLVPLPGSGARAVNALGDPVGTRDGLQRVVQVLTGGSYPFPHGREAVTDAAYAALIGSGYQPPSVSPNQGYDVRGEFRPLNNEELAKYTVKRGQLFKAALEKLGAGADHEAVQAAYQQANAEALATVGAQTATAATRESQTPRAGGVGAVTALARARRALPGLRRARAGGGRVRGGLGRRLGSGRGRGALGRR